MELDGIRHLAGTVDVMDGLCILKIGHHDARIVHDRDGLGLLLGGQHYRHDADGQAGHEYGHEQSGDEETLLLDFVKVLAPYDDSYVVQIHFASSPVTSLMKMSFILGISSL